jgi:hypothetical protein
MEELAALGPHPAGHQQMKRVTELKRNIKFLSSVGQRRVVQRRQSLSSRAPAVANVVRPQVVAQAPAVEQKPQGDINLAVQRAHLDVASAVRPLLVRDEKKVEIAAVAVSAAHVATRKGRVALTDGGDNVDIVKIMGVESVAQIASHGVILAKSQLASVMRSMDISGDDGRIRSGVVGEDDYAKFYEDYARSRISAYNPVYYCRDLAMSWFAGFLPHHGAQPHEAQRIRMALDIHQPVYSTLTDFLQYPGRWLIPQSSIAGTYQQYAKVLRFLMWAPVLLAILFNVMGGALLSLAGVFLDWLAMLPTQWINMLLCARDWWLILSHQPTVLLTLFVLGWPLMMHCLYLFAGSALCDSIPGYCATAGHRSCAFSKRMIRSFSEVYERVRWRVRQCLSSWKPRISPGRAHVGHRRRRLNREL